MPILSNNFRYLQLTGDLAEIIVTLKLFFRSCRHVTITDSQAEAEFTPDALHKGCVLNLPEANLVRVMKPETEKRIFT